jgi:hypothetical protein
MSPTVYRILVDAARDYVRLGQLPTYSPEQIEAGLVEAVRRALAKGRSPIRSSEVSELHQLLDGVRNSQGLCEA